MGRAPNYDDIEKQNREKINRGTILVQTFPPHLLSFPLWCACVNIFFVCLRRSFMYRFYPFMVIDHLWYIVNLWLSSVYKYRISYGIYRIFIHIKGIVKPRFKNEWSQRLCNVEIVKIKFFNPRDFAFLKFIFLKEKMLTLKRRLVR